MADGTVYFNVPCFMQIVADIGDRLMDKLSEGLYVTPTSLVATILSLHGDGIREEDLVSA